MKSGADGFESVGRFASVVGSRTMRDGERRARRRERARRCNNLKILVPFHTTKILEPRSAIV